MVTLSKFVCLACEPWLALLCPAVLIVSVCAGPWAKAGGQQGLNMHIRKEGRDKPVGFSFFLSWFLGGNGTGRQEGNRVLGLPSDSSKGKRSC